MYATTNQYVSAIAVDATSLYWADAMGGTVMKVPIHGGAATTLALAPSVQSLAIDAASVYFLQGTLDAGLDSVPLQGGPTTALASSIPQPVGLAVDAARVYWVFSEYIASSEEDMGVASCFLGGGSPTTLASMTLDAPIGSQSTTGLALSGGKLIWAVESTLLDTPVDGGAATTLATALPDLAASIVADSTNAYVVTCDPAGSSSICTLLQFPLEGGTAVTTTAGKLAQFA